MIYEKAKAEIVLFDNSDVITGSSNCKANGGCGMNGGGHNPGACGETSKSDQCHNAGNGTVIPQSYIDGLSADWLDD